jgi:hypothetical protein
METIFEWVDRAQVKPTLLSKLKRAETPERLFKVDAIVLLPAAERGQAVRELYPMPATNANSRDGS